MWGLSHLLLKFLPGVTCNHITRFSLPCKYERSEGQQEPEIMNNFQYRVVEDKVTCILNCIVSPPSGQTIYSSLRFLPCHSDLEGKWTKSLSFSLLIFRSFPVAHFLVLFSNELEFYPRNRPFR